jgi:hypothetical protein
MWDDWIILAWITQTRLDWVFQFFHNYGVTPFFLVEFPLVAFLHEATAAVLVAKIINVSSVIINAILIMLISRKVAYGNLTFATLAGISAVCFPTISGEGFHITQLIYCFFIPLFLVGILIFIEVSLSTRRRLAIRLCALAALLLSFSFNSLLVMFYALIPAVFYSSLQRKPHQVRSIFVNGKIFIIRHLDFLALPFVFWIIKEAYMPRVGIYARYNQIHFDWAGIFHAYERLIPDMMQTTLFVPLSIPFVYWIVAVIGIIAVLMSGRSIFARFTNDSERTRGHLITLCCLGFFVLVGVALPYYIVGRRSFEAFGFMSRDSVLFPLPISWITAALFCMLLKLRLHFTVHKMQTSGFLWQRVVLGIFVALILAQSLSNWRNHADWQAHYAYYRSASDKIVQDKLITQASVMEIIDRLPGDRTLKTWKYGTSIWTEMVSEAFHKTRCLVIPFPPENGRFFTREEIQRRIRETEIDFMLGEINIEGQQVRVTVEPGSIAQSPLRLALAYWRIRFFVPEDMPKLLDALTRITVEPIQVGI